MRLLLLLLISFLCFGQQTVRLRTGGYASTYRITGINSATPAVVTTKNHLNQTKHTLANGDIVFLQNVQGCVSANGYRKVVNADPDSGKFGLVREDDSPITCETVFYHGYDAARVGKVEPFTLADHPRLLVPTQPGSLDRLRDPDGSGPQVAPVAAENGPAWQGLVTRYTTNVPSFDAACDGMTPALCPRAESRITASGVIFGWDLLNVAVLWQADQSRTERLATVRYWLNHIERSLPGMSGRAGLGSIATHASIGARGSDADWGSEAMTLISSAYSIIRGNLSNPERSALANKVLNGIEPDTTCANLMSEVGSGSTTAATKTVRGDGLSTFVPGDYILVVPRARKTATYQWAVVDTVIDDQNLTVRNNFSTTINNAAVFRAPALSKDFDSWNGKCGYSALVNQHGAMVPYTNPLQIATLSGAMGTTDTTITLNADHANITLATPFWLTVDTETMLVTQRTGATLTVQRAQLYGPAASHKNGSYAHATRHTVAITSQYPFKVTGDWQHNLVLSRQQGFLAAALAFAEDDDRARNLIGPAWAFWYDYTLFDIGRTWTIRGHGGHTLGYQMGRWGDMTSQIAAMMANSTSLNSFGGYLQRYNYLPLYNQWPNVLGGIGEGDWNTEVDDYHWLQILQHFNKGSNEQKYARFWFDDIANFDRAYLYGGSSGMELAALRVMYTLPSDQKADYRNELEPWMFGTSADFGSTPYGVVISKTNWTSTAAMLWINAVNFASDHDLSDGTFKMGGDYVLYKGKTLIAGGAGDGAVGANDRSNFFEIGGSYKQHRVGSTNWNEINPSAEGGDRVTVDQKKGTPDYLYARVDAKEAWKTSVKVQRALRHFVHLKGAQEYVVVYDDAATSVSNQKRTRLHFHRYGDSAPEFLRDGSSIRFKKPTGANAAMVSTKLVFPDGSNPTIADATTNEAYAVTVDWGSVLSAKMIAVHRPSLGTNDTMPEVYPLSSADPMITGVEIADSNQPQVVVFSKDGGVRDGMTFFTALTASGKCLVTGLAAGSYEISRNGQTWLSGQNAGDDGTLMFDCNDGSAVWVISPSIVTAATLSISPSSLFFDYTLGAAAPGPQTFEASCANGACFAVAEESCSWMSVTPTSGATPHTFSVAVEMDGLPLGAHACTVTLTAEGANRSPQSVTVNLQIQAPPETPQPLEITTEELPELRVESPFSYFLSARGGSAPYVWSLNSGSLPIGLSLTPEGEIYGTPATQEVSTVVVTVSDNAQPPRTAQKTLVLSVQPGANTEQLALAASLQASSRIGVLYGRRGLDAALPCVLKLSGDPDFSNVLETITDGGGRSRRAHVFGTQASLSPDRNYYASAQCGSQEVRMAVQTRKAPQQLTQTVKLKSRPGPAVRSVLVEYGPTAQLGGSISAQCTTDCSLQFTAPSRSLLYVRRSYRNSANAVISQSTDLISVP